MSKYINTPDTITINEIEENEFSLSAPQYKTLLIKNKNTLFVRDFLERYLTRSDLGNEVGALNYIGKSSKYFLRTKALQSYSFLPEINSETTRPIFPKVFQQMNLKEGDLIISKDSNIGEIVILDKDYPNHMLQSALYRLPVKKATKYYLLAFIKHPIFREQLDFIVPSGATIRHAKTLFLDCRIPIPNTNKDKVMQYVSLLTQAIINKEKIIRNRHENIFSNIKTELLENKKNKKFSFKYPTINEIDKIGRFDTSLYSKEFKKWNFIVKNYKYGSVDLISRGFDWTRGTSLEKNFIKTRIDSSKYIKGFYELVLPTNISKFGYVEKQQYIGTPTQLKTISQGDIIFGGEGFGKGRTYVVIDESQDVATNYHGIRIINTNKNLTESIFIRCFLAFWREKGMIDYVGVGGSGGHCAPSYFHLIETPKFKDEKQKEIAILYHNPKADYKKVKQSTLDNFLELDQEFNLNAGIYELDKTAKRLKVRLDEVIDKIANDESIEIIF